MVIAAGSTSPSAHEINRARAHRQRRLQASPAAPIHTTGATQPEGKRGLNRLPAARHGPFSSPARVPPPG